MALGSAQPLTDMSTRNLPGRKEWPARKADNLITICEPIVKKSWEPQFLTTLWASMASYRDSKKKKVEYTKSVHNTVTLQDSQLLQFRNQSLKPGPDYYNFQIWLPWKLTQRRLAHQNQTHPQPITVDYYVVSITHQGQWWSILRMQRLQIRQWCALGGR
jgi:hypothetical protein